MPRRIAFTALALMFLTGLVFGQLHTIGGSYERPATVTNRAASEAAQGFYDAIDRFLSGEDASIVARNLAPEFVDHSPIFAGNGAADDLIRYLSSLRSSFPEVRLEVAELIASESTVAVDVVVAGSSNGSFAGLGIGKTTSTPGHELLHIEDGLITERWGSQTLPPLFETVTRAGARLNSAPWVEPRLERFALEAGESFTARNRDGALLIVEHGDFEVVIERDAPGPPIERGFILPDQTPTPGDTISLRAGDMVALPAGPDFRGWLSGGQSGELLTLKLQMLPHSDFVSGAFQPLAYDGVPVVAGINFPAGLNSYDLWIGRAVLPPGTGIPSHLVTGAELVSVIRGELVVTASGGNVVVNGGVSIMTTATGIQTLAAGDGMGAVAGSEIGFRASDTVPAEILFIHIAEPAGGGLSAAS